MRRMTLRVEEQLELVDRLGSKWPEFSQSWRRYAPTNHWFYLRAAAKDLRRAV